MAKSFVPTEFSSYSQLQETVDNSVSVSDWVERSVPILAKMSRDAPDSHRNRIIDQVVFKIISILKLALSSQLIKFPNSASLHRFSLDINFILHLTEKMTTAETRALYDELFDTIAKGSVNNLDRPLPSNSQIDKEIVEIEKMFSEFTIDFNDK